MTYKGTKYASSVAVAIWNVFFTKTDALFCLACYIPFAPARYSKATLLFALKTGSMKKHILLVDDDKDEVKIFSEALNQVPGSFKCTYASSARQALDMLQFLTPDYIVTDFNMPMVNGMQLLREIKKDNRLAGIPFFLYSTTITSDVRRKAEEYGAAGCMEKPTSIDALSKVLKSIFHPAFSHSLSRGK